MKKFTIIAFCFVFTQLNLFAQNVTVNWNNELQTIDGFGASDAWLADELKDHPKRNEIIDLLFTSSGADLSILRQRISPNIYKSDGSYDWTHKDWQGSGWVAQQAKNHGVDKIWGSCWSAPLWMKDNPEGDGNHGGTIKNEFLDDYADWLTTWVEEMKTQYNIEYYGISPQNEPGDKPWEANEWTKPNFESFMINHMKPEFTSRGITAKLLFPEETSWAAVDNYNYTTNLLNSFDILSGHNYGGSPDDYTSIGKPIWHTEHWFGQNDLSTALNMGKEIHDYLTSAKVNSYHWWWAISDKGAGRALVLLTNNNTDYSINIQLWVMGQYSRFIRPGWKRIGATANPTSNVFVSAFKNPSNNKVTIVAVNKNSSNRNINLSFNGFSTGTLTPYRTSGSEQIAQKSGVSGGNSTSVTLAANSITTFTANATPTPGNGSGFTLEAEAHNAQQGVNTYSDMIGHCDDGDWVRFNNVNLENGYNTLKTRFNSGSLNRFVEVRLDNLTGTKIAQIDIPQTGWGNWSETTTTINGGTGTHDIYFVFKGGNAVGNFDWFEFSGPNTASSTIQIFAAGKNNTEQMKLWIDGTDVQTWNNIGGNASTSSFVTFTYNHPTVVSAADIRVHFTNDASGRDLRVDKIIVDGVTHQGEDQAINTGSWSGTCGGGQFSEWMYCPGYIDFGTTGGNPNARIAQNISMTNEDGNIDKLVLFPNPTSGTLNFSLQLDHEQSVNISMVDLTGKEVFQMQKKLLKGSNKFQLDLGNLKSGLYLVKVEHGGQLNVQRVLLKP